MSALLKDDIKAAAHFAPAQFAPAKFAPTEFAPAARQTARRAAAYATPAAPTIELVPTVADQLAARDAERQVEERIWRDIAIRALDIAGALAGLILTAPILAVLAFMITRDGGASLFGQIRVGQNGKGFKCFKLRSMASDAEARLIAVLENDPQAAAEWAENRKLKNDPRITRLGHFIRKTSLDELPQLWNVLKGDMSLVGPRPIVPDELAMYGKDAAGYLAVRPGLTGPWQVSGRSDCDYATRIALDIEWTRTRSVVSYLEIVLKTVPAVLAKDGAY
ncbi:sugar transferase [Pyruvatibacter sp.]|uniref:sugar transferase n=1 Tax=Pyruvatibacter sp. TaxID=1981328 RepID=UPI0032EC2D2B